MSSTLHRETLETAAFRVGYAALFALLLLPLLVVVVTSFAASGRLAFPPESYSLVWYSEFFDSIGWLTAFENSIIVGVGTALFATVLGVLAAFGQEFDEESTLGTIVGPLVLLPLLIPPVILGITLLMYFSELGLRDSYATLVLAHTLWATPLVYFVMRSVFSRFDWQQLDAAYDLGAGPVQAFVHVVLPNVKQGVFVGALLAFIISLQEFVMALFLSTGSTETIPVLAWTEIRQALDPMVSVVSTFLILFSLVALALAVLATNLEWVSKQLS
ncbi:putative spermidine/putrescine transport system permease protein/spermidine/putrescine transport system permease protein [Natronobacterium gregoryi]|uniref:ABC-type spermidine/putrescine transport system, permease component II n=2 Tax=Natronobacterium gregoryi TaxID=44930 RepID=L0AIH7_NATGS|nr:ABC-type spermidine/putrescine transport system, permease component II [Natronobacterium gregoryi SP2]SFJ01248.1 putative spermidine/putrescine transport system permease protein/spermidine/putrescine transport system permease protein [Natronobacterium gregoryi]